MTQDASPSPPLPPKPPARPGKVSLWRYMKLFRRDILSAQPARLYRAWMAEFRTPFFRSFMCNDPTLVDLVLKERPDDFPKSNRVREGLAPLLGNSVFITNGETWKRQRRIIDPAFEGGRVREVFPAMWDAGQACVARLAPLADGRPVEIEAQTSHAAADVIFRTLFSIPIEIRALITQLTAERMAAIQAGTAPDDLATKIMTTPDPETGARFDTEEMVDQVAIFFLAGHETSASALAWALYLLAMFPDWQERVAEEAQQFDPDKLYFSTISRLKLSRDVFRETMRLYPPVPMMVREAVCPEYFRDRDVPKGSQVVLSPWHLHRHERIWDRPDDFDPGRFATPEGKQCMRTAYIPFSAGQRVCPGAGFAMIEGPLLLSLLVRAYRFELVPERPAMPVAHLTVRGQDGIWLRITRRDGGSGAD